jgi:hypothetical protein
VDALDDPAVVGGRLNPRELFEATARDLVSLPEDPLDRARFSSS